MLTQLTRRILGLGVCMFAMLGFLAVPLGERTGFQHAKAIVLSDEAGHFGRALSRAIIELQQHLRVELRSEPPPSEPARESSSRPKREHQERQNRQGVRSSLPPTLARFATRPTPEPSGQRAAHGSPRPVSTISTLTPGPRPEGLTELDSVPWCSEQRP